MATKTEIVTWNGRSLDSLPPGAEPGPGRYVVRVGNYGVMDVVLGDNGLLSTSRAVNRRAAKKAGLSAMTIPSLAMKAVKRANPSIFRFSVGESAVRRSIKRRIRALLEQQMELDLGDVEDLYGLWIGDGYLAAVTDSERGSSPSYYQIGEQDWEDGFTIGLLKNVPVDIAARLKDQGTSDQWYSDGYDAASVAAPYYSADVHVHEPESSDEDDMYDQYGNEL